MGVEQGIESADIAHVTVSCEHIMLPEAKHQTPRQTSNYEPQSWVIALNGCLGMSLQNFFENVDTNSHTLIILIE